MCSPRTTRAMVAVRQGGWGAASRWWWWWDKASCASVSDRIVHLRDMEARVQMLRVNVLDIPIRNTSEYNCAHLMDESLQLFWSEEWFAFSAILTRECHLWRHRQSFITEKTRTNATAPLST